MKAESKMVFITLTVFFLYTGAFGMCAQDVAQAQEVNQVQEITKAQEVNQVQEITKAQDIKQVQEVNQAQDGGFKKGLLIYENPMSSKKDVSDWVMEGAGVLEFRDNWMEMYSPKEKSHHVFWCPKDFPGSFIAEWDAQNLKTEAGLCIVFFSAKGNNGQDIFDPSFAKRDGTFTQYTKSKFFNSYHISYYANGRDNPGREISHLRKNSGFWLVQEKEPGIPIKSTAVHHLKLIKDNARIVMYIDDRKIIDWLDDGKKYGPVLQDGKIAFRQMEWTHFRYRNLKVWKLDKQ